MNGAARILPLLATLAVIAVNAAANIVPINGYQTGELADLYPTGFTPPGWVFGIWSLIYIGLLAFSVWCLLWERRQSRSAAGDAATPRRAGRLLVPYLFSCAANIAWIFAWHYRLVPLSFAVMLALFLSLAWIYVRLSRSPSSGWRERLAVDAPFSLYFGWITAATIVNLATVLYDLGRWPLGFTMEEWALASVATALAIYASMLALTRDLIYGAVFVWAASGIASDDATGEAVRLVAGTGAVAVAVLLAITVGRLVFRRRLPKVY